MAEIELREDQYTNELEGVLINVIKSTLEVEIDMNKRGLYPYLVQEVSCIKDKIAEIGEKLFGIPEMFTYPYTIDDEDDVVFWSKQETTNFDNKPAWWSNEDGWSEGLVNVSVFKGSDTIDRSRWPIGATCVLPLEHAQEMKKKYYSGGGDI